ncbi:MAG: tetratricopeptide repeat protein [Asticcacaulis sp.]
MARKSKDGFRLWYVLLPVGLLIAAAAALFFTGKTGPSGENEWITLFKAYGGDAQAQYVSGLPFDRRRGGSNDEARAVQWYQKAADQGYAEAQIALADLYNDHKAEADRDKAFALYSAVKAPTPYVKRRLSEFYMNGRGSVKNDIIRAENLLREAAEGGDPVAEKQWAQRLQATGDRDGAKKLFGQCADRGDPECITSLAYIYYNHGERPKSVEYFNRAALRGYGDAQIRLAMMYFNGLSVPKDRAESYKWALIASKGPKGTPPVAEAVSALSFLEAQLTPEELTEGKARAAAFKVTP